MIKQLSIILVAAIILGGCLKGTVQNPQQLDIITDPCKGISCPEKCDGTTLNSGGKCIEGKCYYTIETFSPKCKTAPPLDTIKPRELEYTFDTNLLLCDYDKVAKKYTLIYQIRNKSNKAPPYEAVIWLKVPETGYASPKTLQGTYQPERVLWEDSKLVYMGRTYPGQSWEIRDVNAWQSIDYQLIFCEPEFAEKGKCDTFNGLLLASGNTLEVCPQKKT